jgi:hypothetical protein
MDAFERQAAERAERFPTLRDAITTGTDIIGRMQDMGWRTPPYYEHTPRPLGGQVVISWVIGDGTLHYGPEPWPGYTMFKIGTPPEPNRRLMADMDRVAERELERRLTR